MHQVVLGLVRSARPRQWLKNVLVLAAPLAAGRILDPAVWLPIALAFVLFSAASAGIYLVNDLLDVREDRAHPSKRFRPIASGVVPVPVAWAAAAVLLVAAPAVAAVTTPIGFSITILVYELVQLSYCIWLKHVVVIDLVIVSSGFLLRAIGGAAVIAIAPSQWFLLVASFGSLFMVAGKRYSEKKSVDQSSGQTRRSLQGYSESYLRFVWVSSVSVALVAYSLWAFELGAAEVFPLTTITIVPFGVALLRYAYIVDSGKAGAPEDVVLGDRQLQVLGALWFLCFLGAILLV